MVRGVLSDLVRRCCFTQYLLHTVPTQLKVSLPVPLPPSLPYLLSISSQGDTIDDLCRPDLDDKLEELKALSEVRRERERGGG